MTDIKNMQLGQAVDFCIEYNNRQLETIERAKKEEQRGTRRKATQADIRSFFG